MNAILSLIVCIAMIFSPTGTLPAQPEEATTWTVRNVSVTLDDETVTLMPEARITAAVGAEEAQLHFEVGSGEKTLMPMSGAIDKDGVRFTLGTRSQTFTLSDEAFMELVDMDEEDAQMLEAFGKFFLSYGKLFSVMKDEEKYAAYYDASWDMMEDMLGAEFVETEVEVEGEMVPGLQIEGGMTIAGMLSAVDALGECGIPELEEYVDVMLEMVSLVNGEPVEKLADLTAEMAEVEDMDEVIMNMNCVYVVEDPMYSKVDMTMDVEGQEMVATTETLTRGEETVALMVMDMNAEDTAMSYAVSMDYSGPITAPTRMSMVYDVRSESGYSYEYTEDDGSTRSYNSSDVMAMRMTLDGETVDGLKDVAAEFIVETIGFYGYDDDVDTYEETINLAVDYAEIQEQDGSITGTCALEVNAMDQNVQVSFDINRAQGAVVDYFAGTTEQPITADTTDEAGYNALMGEVMGVAADAMALTADESVMDMVALFENAVGYEEEELVEEEFTDYAEYETSTVYSFEEAAAIFDGDIPEYTAPEGYTLKEIVVDAYSLYATFASAEDEFELCTYAYDSDADYFSLQEGKLVPANGPVVELLSYEGEVGSANIYAPDGLITFYFSGIDQAAVEEILAGLN